MNILVSPRITRATTAVLLLLSVMAFAVPLKAESSFENPWTKNRFALLQALALPATDNEQMPSNASSALGHALFFDTSLNPKLNMGCVSCHRPERAFSDGKKHPQHQPLKRNTPGLFGAANLDWFFWDGRKDSLWSQTLEPLYAAHEINLNPDQLLQTVEQSDRYRALYQSAYGEWPDPLPAAASESGLLVQARLGLALATFIGELQYQPTPYDQYIQALEHEDLELANTWLSEDQRAGLEIMLRSNCISCHRGSAFSDGRFHNIGTGDKDPGRAKGKKLWVKDALNCKSKVAAIVGASCNMQDFAEAEIPRLLKGAFKTPSLRELTHTAPYMHDGRYQNLNEVIEHYRHPPESEHGLADIQAISDKEAEQLAAFLRALSSPMDDKTWYTRPPSE